MDTSITRGDRRRDGQIIYSVEDIVGDDIHVHYSQRGTIGFTVISRTAFLAMEPVK